MDNPYLKMLKAQKSDKTCAPNIGEKWTKVEEISLLEELSKDVSIGKIAENHGRTVGGIEARRSKIAYEMHIKDIPIEEIIQTTKLDETRVKEAIAKGANRAAGKYTKKQAETARADTTTNVEIVALRNEMATLRNEMVTLRNEIIGLRAEIKAAPPHESTPK